MAKKNEFQAGKLVQFSLVPKGRVYEGVLSKILRHGVLIVPKETKIFAKMMDSEGRIRIRKEFVTHNVVKKGGKNVG
jgi:hypothetical protein